MRQNRFWTIILVSALVLALLPAQPIYADTITVDTTSDVLDAAGTCGTVTIASLPGLDGVTSLREAMCAANNNTGADTINFNIPGGGVQTIQPTIALPILTDDDTTINGYSQPGTSPASTGSPATLLIELDGTNVTGNNGLNIISARNVISGIVINRFAGNGIYLVGSAAMDNVIAGNYIGTNSDGTVDRGNGLDGVFIGFGAQLNTVGGDTPTARNVISGNEWEGVAIHGSGTMSNTVSGNYIGTDANGTADRGNTLHGVYIYGEAQNNTIGGDFDAGEGNIISGNDRNGVWIRGSNTTGNTVLGNYIGIDKNGTANLGNSWRGVCIEDGAQNNSIGADTSAARNVISGNALEGVCITQSGTTGNTVSGNTIGLDASGTTTLGNGLGVHIGWGAQNNTIGGDTAGERNVISGNDGDGVVINENNTTGNIVSGNYIGTDKDGAADRGNGQNGVFVGYGAQNNTIGGDTTSERNVISGNDEDGVHIFEIETTNNTVSGNYIGTDKNGLTDLGNGNHGVYILDAQNNTIGGDTDGERNIISSNGQAGVVIYGSDTTGNTISGNYIGTDANGTLDRGNAWSGVVIGTGAQTNAIGGDTEGERNVISGNDQGGIYISGFGTMNNTISGNYIGTDKDGLADLGNTFWGVDFDSGVQNNTLGPGNVIAYNDLDGVEVNGASTSGNTITQNSIFSNAMGINLVSGANGGIATPVIITTTEGSVNIVGTACPGCTVEVFENSDTDGEGETYVGDATADGSGDFTVTVSYLTKPYLTATATDATDGTSEFSEVFTATVELAPPVGPVYLPIVVKNH